MSKYKALWDFLDRNGNPKIKLTFDEIHAVMGFAIDHSFLGHKKELAEYGYCVQKISLKEKTVTFVKAGPA